jgi:hypothetical protein
MTKSDKIREYFRKHPDADVAKVAAKFEASKPMTYKLRGQVAAEWKPPEVLPVPGLGRKITLSRAQIEIAQKLGLDPKEYVRAGLEEGLLQYDDEREMGPMPEATPAAEGSIGEVLQERGNRYGTFESNARTCQLLKNVLHAQEGWYELSYVQREALEMMMHKVSRLVNGDSTYLDTVIDIAGYNQLMLEHMRSQNEGEKME